MTKPTNHRQQAASMCLVTSVNRKHVVMPFVRDDPHWPEPNYLNTGMALVGVLQAGQTLTEFRNDWITMKETFERRAMDIVPVKRRGGKLLTSERE